MPVTHSSNHPVIAVCAISLVTILASTFAITDGYSEDVTTPTNDASSSSLSFGFEPSFRLRPAARSATSTTHRARFSSSATGSNLRVTYDPDSQTETNIAADPNDHSIFVGGMNDVNLIGDGNWRPGVVYSHDGGASFTHHATGIIMPTGFNEGGGGDPSLAFDTQGRVYYANIGVGTGALYLTVSNGIFVSRSDDGGTTWYPPVPVVANVWPGTGEVNFEDKEMIAVDTYPGSPYQDRIYVAWTRFYAGNYPGDADLGGGDIMFAYSTDAGANWSTPVRLTDPAHQPQNGGTGYSARSYVQGPEPTVGPDGSVYVIYHFGGRTDMQRSTDGGVTWGMPAQPFGWVFPGTTQIYDHNGSIGGAQLPNLSFRANTWPNMEADPARPGYVYAVSVDDPDNTSSGDGANIVFTRSTDYGATWAPRTQVNDDSIDAAQIFPWMAVSPSGVVSIMWYDTRLSLGANELDVFAAASYNGGLSFSPNFRVTDATFQPNTGQFGNDAYFGDYNGMTAAGEAFYALWADARDGEHELYFDRVCPVAITGDVNDDRVITSADIIYLVNHVFKGGPAPLPCPAAGDVNCDGVITSADIIYLVGYVFKGGAPPCEVCDLIPATWTCP